MLTSENIDKLAPALTKAQSELEHADKTKINPAFRSKYADLAGVVDAIRPVYAKHGLAIVQGSVPAEDGVLIQTRIIHSSGQWIEDEGLLLPLDKKNAQGVGSGITYGRRYTLAAMTGLATDDDDGNAASAKPAPKQAKPRTKPTPEPDAPEYVSAAQAKELTEAAIAAGVDPALAKRKAQLTPAAEFVRALTKLKEQANA